MMISGSRFLIRIFIGITILSCSVADFFYSNGIQKNWHDAKLQCWSKGMELAMLDTSEKHNAAKSYINSFSSSNDVFIGLALDQTIAYPPYIYRYLNGLVPTYLPWGVSVEPDAQSTDFCIRMARSSNLGFHTWSCSSTYDFLCTPVTETTTSEQADTTVVTEYTTVVTEYTTVLTEYTTTQLAETTVVTDSTPGTTAIQDNQGGVLNCFCPCNGYTNRWLHLIGTNYTRDEIKEIMKIELNEMRKYLIVSYKETSAYTRTISSAADSRQSSFTMGALGISILSIVAGLFIFIDCSNIAKMCKQQ